jgi:RND superfamily putative drug exporter
MSGMARWCFQHRRLVVAGWLLIMVLVAGIGKEAGSAFGGSFALPNSDSQAAVTLLTQNFPTASGEGDTVVIQAAGGATIDSAGVRAAVTRALVKVERLPGVASVASPYAAGHTAQVSKDGTVAFATVTWDAQSAQVTTADARSLIKAAESADSAIVRVSLSGTSITNEERPSPGAATGVGTIAALVILLIIFGGALLPALLPLAGAGLALVIAIFAVDLLSHAMSVSSVSTELSLLIGLGVGIDYGLFIISRYRSAVRQGLSYADAAALSVQTSGRTVLLAGTTVCIALLGMLLLGVGFLYGLAVAAAIAVALTMATALTFLPAMLGFLGPRALSRRERAARRAGTSHATDEGTGFWLRWARFVQKRRVLIALGSLAAVVAIALPFFSMHLGSADASTDPAGSTTHQSFTALVKGFGPGFNGPLELAARTGSAADDTAFGQLLATVARGSVGDIGGDLAEREGAAGHRLSHHQPPGPADRQPGQPPARPDHPPGRAGHQPGRPRRRGHRQQHRLRPRPDQQAADLHRGRRAPGVRSADGRVPQPAHPAGRLGHEPAVSRRRPRRHGRGLQLGLGRLPAAPDRDRTHRRVPPGAGVLRPVRAVHGLRGLPGQPHAGRMAPQRRQQRRASRP